MGKRAWILAAATAASIAGTAGAQMMGPGGGMMGGFFQGSIARGSGPFGAPAEMGALANAWLSGLHAQLGITAAQEPAWQAFTNAVAAQAAAMQAFRAQMLEAAGSTAPARALAAEHFMQQRLDAMSDVTDALALLYAQLTPAQRATLDAGFALQCGPWGLFGD